jgi:hypothetical protein
MAEFRSRRLLATRRLIANPYTNVDAWWMSGAEAIPEVRLADEGIRHVLRYSWMSHMIAALQ